MSLDYSALTERLEANMPTFIGTPGNDRLTGTVSKDTLYGRAGNDVLTGGLNNDGIPPAAAAIG